MARLALPANEMNRFDLPAVCLVTGAEADVTFRRVTFRWYPRWLLLLLVPSLLLGAILIEVLTRKVHGELPFTNTGWRRHRTAGIVNSLAAMLMVVGLVGALVIVALDHAAVGAGVAVAAELLPLGLYLSVVRGRRVRCRRITDEQVELEVPDAGAAGAVDQYRHAGTAIPIPAVPAPAEPIPAGTIA